MDFPTITVHAGKHYKALMDSGAAIPLVHILYMSAHGRQFKDSYTANIDTPHYSR